MPTSTDVEELRDDLEDAITLIDMGRELAPGSEGWEAFVGSFRDLAARMLATL